MQQACEALAVKHGCYESALRMQLFLRSKAADREAICCSERKCVLWRKPSEYSPDRFNSRTFGSSYSRPKRTHLAHCAVPRSMARVAINALRINAALTVAVLSACRSDPIRSHMQAAAHCTAQRLHVPFAVCFLSASGPHRAELESLRTSVCSLCSSALQWPWQSHSTSRLVE